MRKKKNKFNKINLRSSCSLEWNNFYQFISTTLYTFSHHMYVYVLKVCIKGVFPFSLNSENYTGDWFWLGGNGEQVRGGSEQKKFITGDQ